MHHFVPFLLVALVAGLGCSNRHGGVGTDTDDTGDTALDPGDIDGDGDGFTPNDGDCDDDDDTTFPGADELCDGIDNNCDGLTDTAFDQDSDGIADCEDDCPVYANAAAGGAGETGTPMAPYVDINDAIAHAGSSSCGDVLVGEGTYPPVDFQGVDVYVLSTDGPLATTILGNGTASVVTFETGETEDAGIEGFTITGGGGSDGAGIYINGASPDIVGNIITGNHADGDGNDTTTDCRGGGLFLRDSSAWIYDNDITDNSACLDGPEEGSDGGGMFVVSNGLIGGPVIDSNRITGNSAGDGGGIWAVYSNGWIVNNLVAGNSAADTDPTAGGQGGGINLQSGSVYCIIEGNLVVDNTASMYGGGIALYENYDSLVAHNTIAYNEVTAPYLSQYWGGGILVYQIAGGEVTVRDNLIYGNGGNGAWVNTDVPAPAATERTIHFYDNGAYGNGTNYAGPRGDLTGVDGNRALNPMFIGISGDGDWTNDNWRLQSVSPYLGTGSDSTDVGATGGQYPYY